MVDAIVVAFFPCSMNNPGRLCNARVDVFG